MCLTLYSLTKCLVAKKSRSASLMLKSCFAGTSPTLKPKRQIPSHRQEKSEAQSQLVAHHLLVAYLQMEVKQCPNPALRVVARKRMALCVHFTSQRNIIMADMRLRWTVLLDVLIHESSPKVSEHHSFLCINLVTINLFQYRLGQTVGH